MVRRRLLRALPAVLVAAGLAVAVVGVVTSRGSEITPTGGIAAPPSPTPRPTVAVARLISRVPAHLLVTSTAPITPAQQKALVTATGAKAVLTVSAGRVFIERGQTLALGVDPGRFRAWTPKGTAESDAVWQSVAAGNGAVAHTVGRAFELPLGGDVLTQVVFPVRLGVGAFATTALPGVGVVVGEERAAELGLVPGTGLLLSVPQRDPDRSAALARAAVPGLTVAAVPYPKRTDTWVVPAVGRVSSGFGLRLHPIKKVVLFHDGVDIAAPYGAPVYAMHDGYVLYAGPARGFGTEVVLSHPGGITTVYGHVSRVLVTSGPVRAGQAIALVGNEGDSTGPHLHAEVRVDDQAVDPVAWLRAHGVRL